MIVHTILRHNSPMYFVLPERSLEVQVLKDVSSQKYIEIEKINNRTTEM